LKKPTGLVRFWFFKPGTGKTEPNRKKTGKKPSQTEKTEPNRENRAKREKTEPNRAKTEPNRFESVFSLKNRTEPNRNRSVGTGFGSISVFF
jgi:hypothetical protein